MKKKVLKKYKLYGNGDSSVSVACHYHSKWTVHAEVVSMAMAMKWVEQHHEAFHQKGYSRDSGRGESATT